MATKPMLMRPGRQVLGHRNLLLLNCGRPLLLAVATFILLVTASHSGVHARDRCEGAGDKSLTTARTWFDLRMWFLRFPECDDGFLAEKVSEYITASLAKRWRELPELMKEIKKTPSFRRFVLLHIDASADDENLRSIIKYATKRCPRGAEVLCESIANTARDALKEQASAPPLRSSAIRK